jgi:hypothetical protein
MTGGEIPPHRYLFHAYTYQYHLMEFSVILINTVRSAPFFFLALTETLSSARVRHGAGEATAKDSALAPLGVPFQFLQLEYMGPQYQS